MQRLFGSGKNKFTLASNDSYLTLTELATNSNYPYINGALEIALVNKLLLSNVRLHH